MTREERIAFNSWKYNRYFELVSVKDEKNINVRCTLCAGDNILSCSKNSTSNLKKHFGSLHGTVKLMLAEKVPAKCVCVCVRVTSTVHLIDPRTLQSESLLCVSLCVCLCVSVCVWDDVRGVKPSCNFHFWCLK